MTVLYGFADVVGALLCDQQGAGPLAWLAVGRGDEDWDQNAPPADRSRRQLTAEVARFRLRPEQDLVFRPLLGVVEIAVTIRAGSVSGPLRELGVFAGDPAGLPGDGTLVHHVVHPVEEVDDDESLRREVRLTLDPDWPAGTRQLVGRLLVGRPGVVGLRWLAVGRSAEDPPSTGIRLADEALRVPLDRRRVSYDPSARTVAVSARLGIGQGPPMVREVGLVGGDPGDGSGDEFVAARALVTVDRTRPVGYTARFTIPLVSRFDIAVPELIDVSVEEATGRIVAASLVAGSVTRLEGDSAAVDSVLAQDPVAGSSVNEGHLVNLVIGAPRQIVVPAVSGLTEAAARAALLAAGLVAADVVVERQGELFTRTVDGTTPPAGDVVDESTVVTIRLGVPRRVRVPDVRGRSPAAATVRLAEFGLRLSDDTPDTIGSSAQPGTVVRQSPAPNSEREIGTTVEITLSEPWSVQVPDLDGLTVDEVADALRAAAAPVLATVGRPGDVPGLNVGAITHEASSTAAGTVIGQRPAAGGRAFLYGAVDIAVATARASVVPDVRQLEQNAAATRLTANNLTLGAIRRRPSRLVAAGVVMDQRPTPGEVVVPGSAVDVVVSSAQRAVVPAVVGQTVAVALEVIRSAGFGLAPLQRAAGVTPGVVLFQTPPSNATVPAGTAIELTVAVGVPNVVGRRIADATHELESLEYHVQATEESVDQGAGTVLRQDPPANTPADPGTTVFLTVGVSALATVPDLLRLTPDAAGAALAAVGLTLASTSTTPDDANIGIVVGQTPAAGVDVPRGSGVAVVVGAPVVVDVEVPLLIGMTEAAAAQELAGRGLVMVVGDRRPSVDFDPGVLIEQEPAPGTVVPPGSGVRVVVAAEGVANVPSLIGLLLEQAADATRAVGLRLDAGRVPAAGAVVVTGQTPAAGVAVAIGSTVSVSVASMIPVPALEGMAIVSARAVAAREGLSLEETFEIARLRPGIVLSQFPQAGELVPVGGVIAVTVSQFGRRPGEIFEPGELDPGPIFRPGPLIDEDPIFRERLNERPGRFDDIVIRPEP